MTDVNTGIRNPNLADLQVERVRRFLQAPDATAGDLGIAARKSFLPPVEPVAFVAPYNLRARSRGWPASVLQSPPPVPFPVPAPPPFPYMGSSEPPLGSVFLLGQGLNRIGHDDWASDFVRPARPSTESRQWLVLLAGERVFVTDDASSNGSFVLQRHTPRLSGDDPRFDPGCSGFRREAEGMIGLGWPGANVVELVDGDVLVAIEAPHVFAWIQPRSAARAAVVQEAGELEPAGFAMQRQRARALLSVGAGATAGDSPGLEVCVEKHPTGLPGRAFLASFTSSAADVLVPLREGRNRVGWGIMGGDLRQPSFAAFDESQWVVLLSHSEAWIVSHVPAPPTIVFSVRSQSHGRFRDALADEGVRKGLLDAPPADSVVLDKYGCGSHRLIDGDILVTRQAALVFGWL